MLKAMGGSGMLPSEAVLFAPLRGMRHIGVAVSGGADSLALMVLASRWAAAQTPSVTVSVYTVDHGLRSSSADDTAIVASAATRLGLACRVLEWQGAKPITGIQAAARAARYRLVGEAMAADGAEILLTAHHARDQAETVLMRMAHASGLKGLGGIMDFARVEGVQVFRPLLAVAPQDLAALVQATGLEAAIDPSNEDQSYERVRWRQVSPALDALGLDAGRINILAQRLQRADAALDLFTHEALRQAAIIDDFGTVDIDLALFTDMAEEVQVRVIRQVLREVGGAQKPFALQAIEALVKKISGGAFSKASLHGCLVMRHETTIRIAREPARIEALPRTVAARESFLWDARFVIFNDGDQPVVVTSGIDMTRQKLDALLGQKTGLPMVSVRAAPLVLDAGGDIVSVGQVILDPSVRVLSKVGSWVVKRF